MLPSAAVVATDIADEVLEALEGNVKRNSLDGAVAVQPFDWSSASSASPLAAAVAAATKPADVVILFADCIYTTRGALLLAGAIDRLLPGGDGGVRQHDRGPCGAVVFGVLPKFRVGITTFEQEMSRRGCVATEMDLPASAFDTSGIRCAGGSVGGYRVVSWRRPVGGR